MTFEEFEKICCFRCGSQRCDPRNMEWLEGCTRFQNLSYKDKAQIITELTLQTKKSNS
jgi:hypothetical protein